MARVTISKPLSKTNCTRVCDTCPWLRSNQGKPHPAKWYDIRNLRRLWNGLRTGEAPGMVCHSSDSQNKEYGGDKDVKPGVERECAGALIMVYKHINEVERLGGFKQYREAHPHLPMTKGGMAEWVWRKLTGALPKVDGHRAEAIGVPWQPEFAEIKDRA